MNNKTFESEKIRKEIEVFQHRCETLITQFEASGSTGEKTRIADEYSRTLKQLEASQFLLELVEKQEKVNRPPATHPVWIPPSVAPQS